MTLTRSSGTGFEAGTPTVVAPEADSSGGLSYYAVDTPDVSSRVYTNGVIYRRDNATGEEFWNIPLDGGGRRAVTRRANGYVQNYDYDASERLVSVLREIIPGYSDRQADTDGDGTLDTRSLEFDGGRVDERSSLADIMEAERRLMDLDTQGVLGSGYYGDFAHWTSGLLLTGGGIRTAPAAGTDLSLDPIGAFYESRSRTRDAALSIADRTPVILDAARHGMTAAALAALDTDRNGRLSTRESANLRTWVDLNENGVLEAGELKTLAQAGIGEIRATDYAFYTRNNALFADATRAAAPDTVPDSNYRALRDTDNVYYLPDGWSYIQWTSAYLKVSPSQRDTLIGTDRDDSFDAASFERSYRNARRASWFDFSLLTNFLGGNGNDFVGGSNRNDSIWGGLGNDLLFGYRGNDRVYGEEGNDELQGNEGNDTLKGGIGNDRLFGQVGNDVLFGGNGDDILVGFAGANETAALNAGESDDDWLYGGAGNDLMWGQLGNDNLWGGTGNDELQGNDGNDMLYGQAGDDRLFGQRGNDVLYGADGNDILVGFTGGNETRQTLGVGESDDDWFFGGAGSDTLLGGPGHDYLDGGTGADVMEGGTGDDSYIVNSVNDSILELPGAGYDTVVSSVNYLLNAQIEELRLVEGLEISGTGNALDNRIVGNDRDNILDGVTGRDLMIGGGGNDTYYADNEGDQTIEVIGEGLDTVQTTIDHTLGANLENLVLLDFSKPEKGLVDGMSVLVYGYPKANELDYMQGDAVPDFLGTCALTSIANLLTQVHAPATEGGVVQLAIDNRWAVTDPARPSYQRGGSSYGDQQRILDSYGIANGLLMGYNEAGIANLIRSGRGVILALNAGRLWDEATYVDDGRVNHVVTVTGVAYRESDGKLMGFYIADSGRRLVSDMTRFVGINDFRRAVNVPSAYAIYTTAPLKMWDENIDGRGNELDNLIVGNRGDNRLEGAGGADTLEGGAGNDSLDGGGGADILIGGSGDDTYTLNLGAVVATERPNEGTDTVLAPFSMILGANIENLTLTGAAAISGTGNALDNLLAGNAAANTLAGGAGADTLAGGGGADVLNGGAGNDTYRFGRGDGLDRIGENDATAGNTDVLRFDFGIGSDDLWFRRSGANLEVSIIGTSDRLTVANWYSGRAYHVEQFRTTDGGNVLLDSQVDNLVQAMAAFAPPAAGQTTLPAAYQAALAPVIAANWH